MGDSEENENMRRNVQFIQPILTEYRKKLFEELDARYNIIVSYSEVSPFGKSISNRGSNKNIKYTKCGKWLNFFDIFYWQLNIKIDKSLRAGDAIIFCGSLRHLSILTLIVKAKLNSLKIVWWSHGRSIRPAPFFDKIRRYIMKYMDFIILYTESEYNSYIKYGFKSDSVFFINNTIDESKIINAKKKWNEEKIYNFRKKLNIPNNAFIFLFCGRLRRIPGTLLDQGIYAFNELLKIKNNCYFFIIGSGEALNDFKNIVSELKIEKNVIFLGEEYSEDKLAPYFLASNAFLYPGYIGLSLVHALWYGLPVITHDNMLKHAPEFTVLKNNYNSIKYKELDKTDLVRKLIELVSNKSQLKLMNKNAIISVSENWTFNKMIKNYDNAISKILLR